MFFDPLYLAFMLPGLLLSLWASFKTQSAFKRYSQVRTARGVTGAQAAAMLLERAGIRDVQIEATRGNLTDHYNPLSKKLALSEGVYGQASIAAVGVACHEAGHALQHAAGYAPLKLRSLLVKPASFGSQLGFYVMFIGLAFQSAGMFQIGAVLFSAFVLFTLITLPVEFDASNRAKRLAVEQGILAPQERAGMDRVLNAAALTYVAAAASSILTLLYFLMRAGVLGSSQRD
jgi:Zn-dependent membrane protease YugP